MPKIKGKHSILVKQINVPSANFLDLLQSIFFCFLPSKSNYSIEIPHITSELFIPTEVSSIF